MEIVFYVMLALAALLLIANVVLSVIKKRRKRDAERFRRNEKEE